MSLGSHLKELRKRLAWSGLFVILGMVGGWFLYEPVYAELKRPVDYVAAKHGVTATLNFPSVMGAFDLHLQVSLFLGVLISSPIWLYNIWAFITPALRKRERRYTVAFLLSATPLFASGVWLAWQSYPNFVDVLLSMAPPGSTNIINAADYLLFALRLFVLFGVSFVTPVVLVLLNLAELITAKNIFGSWRLAIFLIAVVAAVATPTADPMSMFVLMVPLGVLYFSAGAVALLIDRRRSKRALSTQES